MTAHYQARTLNIALKPDRSKVIMSVRVPEELVATDVLPHTLTFLETHCSSVLCTKCFNPGKLSFREEVTDTELAHLFEHIILDLLVQVKVNLGAEDACFSGETRWDWRIDPVGTFEIELGVPKKDQYLLDLVLPRAIELIEELCQAKLSERV